MLVTGCWGGADSAAERQGRSPASPQPSAPAQAQPQTTQPEQAEQSGVAKQPDQAGKQAASAAFPYEREVVAAKLNVPWDMAIAPDGRIFLTERTGAIRVIDNKGKLLQDPVYKFEDTFWTEAEAGLLGLALDPDFANNRRLYVYHTYKDGTKSKNRLVRLVEQDNKARIDKVLLDNLPGERIHDGGRVRFGPDGKLYFTNGDANDRPAAQELGFLGGKIMRLNPDGTIPDDNPFPGSPVYSLGHRNPQGLAWHPVTKALFSTEHGQTAHDEVNIIEKGANYGWPYIQGDEAEPNAQDRPKLGPGTLKKPLLHSGTATWAPSGITFVTKGPWAGNLLVANLRGTQLQRIILGSDYKSVQSVEELFKNELGRLRSVVEGPDGSLYLMTNNRDGRGQPKPEDDQLIRLKLRK
jgi:glucose/arabinose dehydrogenase